jgi:hypothetical protein
MSRLIVISVVLFSLLLVSAVGAQDAMTPLPTTIRTDGITFTNSFPTTTTVIGAWSGYPVDESWPGGFYGMPMHTRVDFPDYVTDFFAEGPTPAVQPVMHIFDTRAYTDFPFWSQDLTELQSLVADQQVPAIYTNLPFVPPPNATQVLYAQPEFIGFDGGSGVRYLTYFAQDASPLMSYSVFYTFQGVTDDGARRISISLPLVTDLLPGTLPDDFDWDAFSAGHDAYLADTVAALNAADPDSFTPPLARLDSFVRGLSVTSN